MPDYRLVVDQMQTDKYLGVRVAIAIQLLGWAMGANILALMGMTSHSHHLWRVFGLVIEYGQNNNERVSLTGIAYCCMSWLSGVTI